MGIDIRPRTDTSLIRADIIPLLLGTVAKTCLNPMAMEVFQRVNTSAPAIPPQRPRIVRPSDGLSVHPTFPKGIDIPSSGDCGPIWNGQS
jgi:hypothetical protein